MSIASSLWDLVGRVAHGVARQQRDLRRQRSARRERRNRSAPPGFSYPGDHHGPLTVTYDPHPGTLPDPGEVVWTWVPYEEDHSQGKDRPVLIIGRERGWLLGLPLSSVNHQLDAAQERAEGRDWVPLGKGPWDARGKSSSVRVNRVVRVDPRGVRRVGGRLDRDRFDRVARAVRSR